ncbi:MAG: helix-turn-helix domain-containing protein [Pseudomonadota bacterium]
MTTIPISWIVTILFALAAMLCLAQTRWPLMARLGFAAFFGLSGLIFLIIGLRVEYQATGPGQFQPHLAAIIPATLWAGFYAFTQERAWPLDRWAQAHLALLLIAQIALIATPPQLTDAVILSVTALYIAALIHLLVQPADRFVHLPPQSHDLLLWALGLAIGFLATILLTDAAIAIAASIAGDLIVLRCLTSVSGILTITILVLTLVAIPILARSGLERAPKVDASKAPLPEDKKLVDALNILFQNRQLHRDPNLTLSRLAKRLAVPVRTLSHAINSVTGENFSRFVNTHRIEDAKTLLITTDLPITEIMFDAGFVSKSRFNSEFKRITGQAPSAFKAQMQKTERSKS